MFSRILKIPLQRHKSFFLLGPRGTGKTSWIKSHFESSSVYIDLLDMSVYTDLLANPGKLAHLIPANYQDWVVIDEVQRIPDLLNEVHRLIESKHHKFVLTGSSARNLRKKGVNLLAGRALVYHMHPLIIQETGEQFNLKSALQFGMLPSVFDNLDPSAYLKAYVNTYLREEVLQEGLTRNLSAFSRFLETASFSQGQILNISSIAREAGIQQKTISNYFDILEDLLLGFKLPIFARRAKRETIQHPKFYFFDAGVFQILRPKGLLDSANEIEGAALETLFLQHLRAINDYYSLDYKIYYWRTRAGVEVDFIVYGEKGFYAFEIKRSEKASIYDVKNLKIFQQEFPMVKCFLIYCGQQRLYFDDIEVLPIVTALKELPKILETGRDGGI